MSKFKKSISLLLTVLLLFLYVTYPVLSYAQDVTPTDTPAPTDSPTPTYTPTPAIDPSSPTDTPTPTPTIDPSLTADPTDTPAVTPTPTPDQTDISNNADANDNSQSSTTSGDNTITTTNDATNDATLSGDDDSSAQNPSADSSGLNSDNSSNPTPNSSINTGNATSETSIVNDVNTNSVNSTVVNQAVNIFVAQNGDLNLSDPFTIASEAISAHPEDSVINVSVVNVNNYAYITNDIASAAITGENLISIADQSASITTGNADSAVSLLNKINFTVVNSQIHLVTINIFGNLNGNIILPDPNASTNCTDCGVSTTINNTATVNNNLSSTADSGNNSIVATGSATISTGNAQSAVNSLNIVNTNVSGTNAEALYINDYGTWNGSFIGWDNFAPANGGASLVFFNFSPNQNQGNSTEANISNSAFVDNNVSSLALSGGNSISGGDSAIVTGNSFSAISLMNFINTDFLNSFGFFGFINIFGNWTGDIGGASQFAALSSQNTNSDTVSTDNTNTNSDTTQEQGGELSVDNSNNVAAFVYPGDTVTFFINVRNSGTSTVYGTKLNLTLVYGGQSIGTASFNLGDIPGGQGGKVTTGIVLPKNTLPGYYIAVADVSGNIGPDNSSVSASSNSDFTVFGSTIVAAANFSNGNPPKTTVLGSTNKNSRLSIKNAAENLFYISLIFLLFFTYLFLRLIRGRKYVFEVISSPSFKEKLTSLRMLLL